MKIKLFFIIMLMHYSFIEAQNTVAWLNSSGGTDSDSGHTIKMDSNNNVFVAGQFRGLVSFDPDSDNYDYTSGQFGDVFLQKFNENGDFLWAKVFLNENFSERPIITVDSDGNLYISSSFKGSIDLDPGPNSDMHTSVNNLDNTYLVKLNNNGDYIWGKTFENITSNQFVTSNEIAVDNYDNILILGEFQSTVDFNFDPNFNFNLTSTPAQNGFILKIDNNGNFVWVKQFSGIHSRVFFSSLEFDSQNNIIAGGSFFGVTSTDFDPGNDVFNLITPNTSGDLFILKLTQDGDFLWVKKAEGYDVPDYNGYIAAEDRIHSLAIDINDNIIFTGVYKNIIDFDPNSTSFVLDSGINSCINCSGSRTGFIAKMDMNGSMIWARKIEGDNYAASSGNAGFYNTSILLDFNQNHDLFFGYGFRGSLQYEINGVSHSYTGNLNRWQISLFQISPTNGDYISAHIIGNSANTFLGNMVFRGNDLYATGTYMEELFFDSNTSVTPTNNSNSSFPDVYTVKYENVITLSVNEFNVNKVSIYPNPASTNLNISGDVLMDKIVLRDINGRVLKTENLVNKGLFEHQINVRDLSIGVYFLEIHAGKNIHTLKFIKN